MEDAPLSYASALMHKDINCLIMPNTLAYCKNVLKLSTCELCYNSAKFTKFDRAKMFHHAKHSSLFH
jgi:hypothetical protein